MEIDLSPGISLGFGADLGEANNISSYSHQKSKPTLDQANRDRLDAYTELLSQFVVGTNIFLNLNVCKC